MSVGRLSIEFVDFERLKEHFSTRAVVVELRAMASTVSVPIQPPIPVVEFMWPRPTSWAQVTIIEPDIEGLRDRFDGELPEVDKLDVVGGDLLPDTMSFRSAGDTAPICCPVCSRVGVYLLSSADAEPVIRSHAERVMGVVTHRPSDRKGIRWQVDGDDLDAFRCPTCLSLLVNGPSDPAKVRIVEMEDA